MKNILLLLFLALGVCAEELCFVQITDTHFGKPEHGARVEKAVDAINALPFDVQFVAVTGDVMADSITDKEAVNKAVTALGRLKMPVHFVAGNHDIDRKNPEKTAAAYIESFGPLSFPRTYAGVECLFIYTEPLAFGFSVPGYDPLALLKSCSAESVLVFHHTASVSDFYNNKIHIGWQDEEGKSRWHAALKSCGVDGVVTGHFHRGELHWIGDIPVHVAPPIADYWGRQASFRIYHYKNGRLGYRTQYIQ